MNNLGNHSLHKLYRFPEPELMSDQLQVDAYANANFEEAHSSLIRQLLERLPKGFKPTSILDLGCGPGDMAFRLASAFPDANITFLDGSELMIKTCLNFLQTKNSNLKMESTSVHSFTLYSNGSPKYKFICDLVQNFIPYQSYDLVFSNSLLHHVRDPYEFWACIQRSVDENSLVFVSDLLRPESFEIVDSLVTRYANEEPEILRRDFYNSLLAAYSKDEIVKMLEVTKLYSKFNFDQTSDRHWICYSKPIYI